MSGLSVPRPRLLRLPITPVAVAALTSLWLVGCAATKWSDAKNLSVTWDQFESGVSLTLVNKSHQAYQDLYSRPRSTSNIKILADEDMAALLDQFQHQGFFDWAEPAREIGDEVKHQLSGRITVNIDGRASAIMLLPRGNPLAKLNAFGAMREDFRLAYDSAFALQSVENDKGSRIFAEEQERLSQGSKRRDP